MTHVTRKVSRAPASVAVSVVTDANQGLGRLGSAAAARWPGTGGAEGGTTAGEIGGIGPAPFGDPQVLRTDPDQVGSFTRCAAVERYRGAYEIGLMI